MKRLKDDCENGLFMQPGTETINGRNNTWIQMTIARVCFSEIKLSIAEKHANLYGRLGIGFDRKFIIELLGNPVIYVQNSDKGLIVESFDKIRGFINGNKDITNSLEIALGFVKICLQQKIRTLNFTTKWNGELFKLMTLIKYIWKNKIP